MAKTDDEIKAEGNQEILDKQMALAKSQTKKMPLWQKVAIGVVGVALVIGGAVLVSSGGGE